MDVEGFSSWICDFMWYILSPSSTISYLFWFIYFLMKLPLEMTRTRGWWNYWMIQRVTMIFHYLLIIAALCCKFCIFCNLETFFFSYSICFAADQAVSETIPLSPQWLYAKPNEPKMVNVQPHPVSWFLG